LALVSAYCDSTLRDSPETNRLFDECVSCCCGPHEEKSAALVQNFANGFKNYFSIVASSNTQMLYSDIYQHMVEMYTQPNFEADREHVKAIDRYEQLEFVNKIAY